MKSPLKNPWFMGGMVAVVVVVGSLWFFHKPSDAALAGQLIGTWKATDPSNAALHKQKEPVASEEVVIQKDGNLLYTFASPANRQTDRWGWKVQKGRLVLQFRGEGGTDDWMMPVRFTISGDTLSLHRRNFPAKEFVRAGG